MKIKNVLIVGGGSSGWMTAAALVKQIPWLTISLVESPSIPTIGVGESTIGQINTFFKYLGLTDEDWMKHCNATYKTSIRSATCVSLPVWKVGLFRQAKNDHGLVYCKSKQPVA